MLRVMDGDARLRFLMFHWNDMVLVDQVLSYCIKSNLTGQNLYEWIEATWGKSFLEPYRELVARMEHDDPRAIVVGKDFVPRQPRISRRH